MMILSAVVLVLAFIALAGMVARVSQLASQTTAESDRVILSDVAPLAAALDASICRLKDSTLTSRTVASVTYSTAGGVTTLRQPSGTADFAARDVGMEVSGTGIPAGTRILSVSGDDAVISQAATGASGTVTFASCLETGTTTDLNLGAATTPRLEDAVREVLGHMEALEAQHGFWMTWSVDCWSGTPDPAGMGRATVAISDGTAWVRFRSTVPFAMSGC